MRLWHVTAGAGRPALLLGPIAVDPRLPGPRPGREADARGARARAGLLGQTAVLLVGDAPYYARFGFSTAHTGALRLPGPVERDRFLGLELAPGALAGARGLVAATGEVERTPALAAASPANDGAARCGPPERLSESRVCQ